MNIIKELDLHEISAVDNPAQEGARMTIMKRDPAKKSPVDSDRDEAAVKGGDPVSQEEKQMADEAKKVADLEKTVADLTKNVSDLTKASADKDAKIAELTKSSADAEAKVAEVTKAKEAVEKDEVIKVGDTEIRKSVVGDGTFAAMKAQEARIAKAEDARELVELTKRVETEFGSLPGEPLAKAKTLRAIAKMSEEDSKALTAMLKAGEEAMKSRMREIGQAGGSNTPDSAEGQLNKLADEHAAKHNVNKAKAMDEVLKTAEGARLYGQQKAEHDSRAARLAA